MQNPPVHEQHTSYKDSTHSSIDGALIIYNQEQNTTNDIFIGLTEKNLKTSTLEITQMDKGQKNKNFQGVGIKINSLGPLNKKNLEMLNYFLY